MLFIRYAPAQAQSACDVHASIADVRGATRGVGGKLAGVVSSSPGLTVALEGVGEILSRRAFPRSVTPLPYTMQANPLVRRQMASYVESYGGAGVIPAGEARRRPAQDRPPKVIPPPKSNWTGSINPPTLT